MATLSRIGLSPFPRPDWSSSYECPTHYLIPPRLLSLLLLLSQSHWKCFGYWRSAIVLEFGLYVYVDCGHVQDLIKAMEVERAGLNTAHDTLTVFIEH